MRSYMQILCGLLMAAAVMVLAGCANDDNPGPVQARDLGTRKGEVLVPYEPLVSRKITQDPSGFPMPAPPTPPEAPASAPTETPVTETPAEATPGSEVPAATPSETPAPATPPSGGSTSGSSGLGELPPTAPAPIGLGN